MYLSVICRLALLDFSLNGKLHGSKQSLSRTLQAIKSYNVLILILTQQNPLEGKMH